MDTVMLGTESFFELDHAPFEQGAQAPFVLSTRPLRRLLGRLRADVASGEAQLCVNGAPGVGKSAAFRALPKALEGIARVARISDPQAPWPETAWADLGKG